MNYPFLQLKTDQFLLFELKLESRMEFTMYLQRMLDNEIATYEEVNPKRVILIPRQYSQEESVFDEDLKNLKARFPDLGIAMLNKTPYKIEMSLTEISQVCPRNRQRIDSYCNNKKKTS